jgi:hypothetical protein
MNLEPAILLHLFQDLIHLSWRVWEGTYPANRLCDSPPHSEAFLDSLFAGLWNNAAH